MGSCGDRAPQCIIYSGPHKMEEHCCGVAGCSKVEGKICTDVTVDRQDLVRDLVMGVNQLLYDD